jgi:hypothetical protein
MFKSPARRSFGTDAVIRGEFADASAIPGGREHDANGGVLAATVSGTTTRRFFLSSAQ